MRIVSVNVGQEEPLANAKSGQTGIFKRPVAGPVRITRRGLDGDHITDTANHGGPDQAVYVFGTPDNDWWQTELGRRLAPGTWGENLTLSDLQSAQMSAGDRLRIGSVCLEVTGARIPCVTLARRMDDPDFVTRFRRAERPGVYCRVIEEGDVRAGDAVIYEPHAGPTVTTLEMFRDFFEPDLSEAAIRRFLAAPVAIRYRQHKERQLASLREETRGTTANLAGI